MIKPLLSVCLTVSLTWTLQATPPETNSKGQVDVGHVIVVGTGMAELSAALEAAHNGARVTVLEMWSVFGGTSFISGGKLAIVGTALQKSKGVKDSPDLAFQDFVNCGQDLDRDLDCMTCHSDMTPYQEESHRIDMQLLSHHCGTCHLSKDEKLMRRLSPAHPKPKEGTEHDSRKHR